MRSIRDIRGLLKSFKIKTYNEDTGYGLFRHVLIRTGYHSGQIMVVLVLGSPILPSKNNFVKALRKLHPGNHNDRAECKRTENKHDSGGEGDSSLW